MPVRRLGGSSLHVSVCSSQTSGPVARNARRSTERTLEPLGAGGAVQGGERNWKGRSPGQSAEARRGRGEEEAPRGRSWCRPPEWGPGPGEECFGS